MSTSQGRNDEEELGHVGKRVFYSKEGQATKISGTVFFRVGPHGHVKEK